jgi:hypothetical protein
LVPVDLRTRHTSVGVNYAIYALTH